MLEGLIALVIAHEVSTQKVQLDKTSEEYKSLQTQKQTQGTGSSSGSSGGNVAIKYNISFDVTTRGSIKGNAGEFASFVESTLRDSRGWRRAGVNFTKVASGGKLHVVLASGAEIDKYAGCSADLSCTVFPYVLINDARWLGATQSYNSAGLSLTSYRQMVINHEVGHYLGHDHV